MSCLPEAVAGKYHTTPRKCTPNHLRELTQINSAIWKAPAIQNEVTFLRGGYVNANITRLKDKTIAVIPMPFPFLGYTQASGC